MNIRANLFQSLAIYIVLVIVACWIWETWG